MPAARQALVDSLPAPSPPLSRGTRNAASPGWLEIPAALKMLSVAVLIPGDLCHTVKLVPCTSSLLCTHTASLLNPPCKIPEQGRE